MTVETGSTFVSNYPPFAAWTPDALPAVMDILERPPSADVPLGVYVHTPFCRKRCRFCYFKVYTETPAAQIRAYVDAVAREASMYRAMPFLGGRRASFVYFGGGTPSYLSSDQLHQLFDAVRASFDWAADAEITFECEPGTLREEKLVTLRRLGVTRLSIGVESFDPSLLEINGRAHGEAQIEPAYRMARAAGFPQINLDLIAGMVGETDATWRRTVERTIALAPDSVTIYQMEIPGNTVIYKALRDGREVGGDIASLVQRRAWAAEAFTWLEEAGYVLSSGYTARRGEARFVYRDSLWHGADLVPLGVSAFGHIQGAHLQNDKDLDAYLARVGRGELPLQRGLVLTAEERLIRELILQMKLGWLDLAWFRGKFGVDVLTAFAAPFAALQERGLARVEGDTVRLSREALMQVDRLLPAFFQPEHGGQQRAA